MTRTIWSHASSPTPFARGGAGQDRRNGLPTGQQRLPRLLRTTARLVVAALAVSMLLSLMANAALAAGSRDGASAARAVPPPPRTPAQQRYDAWLAQQQAKVEQAKLRLAPPHSTARLPNWKPNAHEAIATGSALPHFAITPHAAVAVTTDPNNWTSLGPSSLSSFGDTYSGNVTALSASATNLNDLWIATSSGGVWHSADGGTTWTPTTDSQPTLSFGTIAVDPANDAVIYAGSGDPNNLSSGYSGAGIFKTSNNGTTWTQESSTFTNANAKIYKIAIDPSNDQTILAAISSDPYYFLPAVSGLWRSTDGGATWSEVLDDSANTNGTAGVATDVVFDPANPAIVYAGLGNLSGSSSTTTIQGVYKSADHGATWTLVAGAPSGQSVGRMSLAISHDGAHLYAAMADSGFSGSTNAGALLNSSIYEYNTGTATWSTISLIGSTLDTNSELGSGWNDNDMIAVAPTDSTGATVYLGHYGLYLSSNSGATWTQQGASAGITYGQLSLTFPSATSSAFYVTNVDGIWHYASGVFTGDNTDLDIGSARGGNYGDTGSDSPLDVQMTAPLYGTFQYPAGSTGAAAWTDVNEYGGGSADTIDWSNNAIMYATREVCTNGGCTTTNTTIEKSTNGGASFNPTALSTTDAIGFSVPPTISPTHPQSLFYGTTRLWATTDGGTTWNTVSPQLDTTPYSGPTCSGPSDIGCPFIGQVVVAPSSDNVIVVAYDDGQTFATTNGGTNWYPVAELCAGQPGCASGSSSYTLLAISPSNPQVMYAYGYYNGTSGTIAGVFVSSNSGHGWSLLPSSASLPFGTDGLAISPANPHLILLWSYSGAFISSDDGQGWSRVTGLPMAGVTGAFFSHDGSQLFVTTYGRGVWAIAMPHLTLSSPSVTLTTPPGTSPSSQVVTLHNTGQGPLSWATSGLPSWLGVSPGSGTIAAGSSATVTLSFNTPSTTPQTYTTTVAFSGNADDANITLPVVVSSSLSKTWYFAEGYTGGSFTEYLTLANPNPVAANVSVEYLLQNNAPPLTKSYSVNPNSRRTLTVNSEIGVGTGVALVVTSDQPIVAERPMYFTFTGDGLHVPGGSDVLGATSLGTQFDFGYLDTTANHATYLTVLNPSGNPMAVSVSYFAAAGGGTPTVVTHSVAANARGTFLVNGDVPAGSYSALVSLSTAGLVERPMYLTDATTGDTGSADVIGVQQPATSWSFAEGYTSATFSERYILSNPSTSATATATLTFLKSDGSTATASVTLNPGQQQVVSANSVLGNGVNNSATVTSDQPVLAERFISFRYTGPVGTGGSGGNIPGASDVLGAPSAGQVYDFAEGYTGAGFAEYLTLENPNSTTTQVSVTYLPQNGGPATVDTYFVGAHSRYTILTNQVMPNQSFSLLVIASQPIVAERPMYFAYKSTQTGGSDVVGYQP